MSYAEFKEALMAELEDFYNRDAKIFFKEVLKTNGVKLDGLNIVFDQDVRVNPVIYVNDLFEEYSNGEMTFDEVVGRIVETRERSGANTEIHDLVSNIMDWDQMSDSVFPLLINSDANKELLKDLVSREFLDLSVIYAIRIPGGAQDIWASVKITKGMFEGYGISEDELHEQAMINLRDKDSLQVHSMYETLMKLNCVDIPIPEISNPNMYVLSNRSCNHGASQLLNMSRLGEEYEGRSFYVIPSSIHEAILVDYQENIDPEELNAMIRDVNDTVLDTAEVLSDHVYFYDGVCKEIRMCA